MEKYIEDFKHSERHSNTSVDNYGEKYKSNNSNHLFNHSNSNNKKINSINSDNNNISNSNKNDDNWLDNLSRKRIKEIFEATSYRGTGGIDMSGRSNIKMQDDKNNYNNGYSNSYNNSHSSNSSSSNYKNKIKHSNPLFYSKEETELRCLFTLIIELPIPQHPVLFEERLYTGIYKRIMLFYFIIFRK